MSTAELVEQVKALPASERRKLVEIILELDEDSTRTPQPHMTEDQFLQMLLQKGIISNIPDPSGDADEDDQFEPIAIQGGPLSETVIEERR